MVRVNIDLMAKETITENLCLSCLTQIRARFCSIAEEVNNNWPHIDEQKIKKWAQEIIKEWNAYHSYTKNCNYNNIPQLKTLSNLINHFFKSDSSRETIHLLFKELEHKS